MIFKNNKYKSLIIAVLITIIVGIFAFKLIDNIGMLIVTHNIELAKRVSNRIVYMDDLKSL